MKTDTKIADALSIRSGQEKMIRTLEIANGCGETATLTIQLEIPGGSSDFFFAKLSDRLIDLQSRAEDLFSN